MKSKIRVTFARRSSADMDLAETIQLSWTLNKTPIALKYFKALEIAANTGTMYRRDRFYSFPRCYYTKAKIIEKLNESIQTINEYHPNLIPVRVGESLTQDQMNFLHTFFEKYRGGILRPAQTYEQAPPQVKEAFDEFNLMIHRYEDEGFSGRIMGAGEAKFYVTFGLCPPIQRYPLAEEDFTHFTFKQKFGDWLLNYCEVGKPLHDVWRDGDSEIGHEAIMPLHYYSADAMIGMGHELTEEDSQEKYQQFYKWWDQNQERLNQLGFKKDDPKNSIGHICLAELDRDHPLLKGRSNQDIVELLSYYQWTSKVECLNFKEY